mgnify:FL=1
MQNKSKRYLYFYNDKLLTLKDSPENWYQQEPFHQDLQQDLSPSESPIVAVEQHNYFYEVLNYSYIPEGYTQTDIRTLLRSASEEDFSIIARCSMLAHWNRRSKYCGVCGAETTLGPGELVKKCEKCGEHFYPQMNPAVIVAITRGNEILLGANKRFKGNMYSTIAGFVEPGEQFEQAVAREIMEEVGVTVKNIKYFASHPWPFPNSIMIGFTAEYDSGTPTPDGNEIIDVQWFTKDSLPQVPPVGSIARKLIDHFIKQAS